MHMTYMQTNTSVKRHNAGLLYEYLTRWIQKQTLRNGKLEIWKDDNLRWWWSAVLKTWREEWNWREREVGSMGRKKKRGTNDWRWRWAVILDFWSFIRREWRLYAKILYAQFLKTIIKEFQYYYCYFILCLSTFSYHILQLCSSYWHA